MLPEALAAFAVYQQFIIYKTVPSASRPRKTDKFPCDWRTGRVVSAHDPQFWTTHEDAQRVASELGESFGVGFVFTEQDPFWFVDIDNCLIDDQWSPIAQQLCTLLSGAAVEVSQSGRGLHIFGLGQPPAHGCRNESLGLEFYHSGRFVALTGSGAIGNCAADMTAVLPTLVATYFPPDESQSSDASWTDAPCVEWNGPTDDADLIRRAMQSRSLANTFGGKASFADLWLADENALSKAFPDEGRPYDCNRADSALAQHLAFWTGKDCERIRTLMMQSRLVRDKWEREDYLPRTILAVVGRQVDVLEDKASPVASESHQQQPKMVEGETILNADAQITLFGGCIYIQDQHRAMIPGGKLLKPDQFRVHFGGYIFQMDPTNERTSRDPWEAWTQSRLYRCPKVDGTCFRPNLEAGVVIERNDQSFVNTYVPITIRRVVGDPKPFLNHLAKVLPEPRDREILLAYMAACVQHKGIKFQWAPLLQGVEGNGKTLFTRCVAEAIGRRYSHFPPATEISEKFNSWLFDTIFVGIEDIYVPHQKQEIFEILKPMITSDYLAKRAMQTDQVMREVVANFIFNSNHKDGLKKTHNDRRICTLFCAQQRVEDLKRDGMDPEGDYFPKLYEWLRADGYAIVADLLHTYPIPAVYNPAGDCQRAPKTTSTEEAIRASTGGVEQEIEEAIAQGLPGFCGGWISSIWLERLLERIGLARRITHSKRRDMLEIMGYHYHPALREGRVNNVVVPDGGKPRLFIHESSLACEITDAIGASKAYETANTGGTVRAQLPFSTHRQQG